jgi:hypothetical protein
VLIAVLNIFRVYYNWLEARQYIAKRVPGTDQLIQLAERTVRRPVHRTPALRLGVQREDYDRHGKLIMRPCIDISPLALLGNAGLGGRTARLTGAS